MTKKITAYGSVVVAALVMGFALLTAASAAPSVSDESITITGDDTQTLTAIDVNQGSLGGAVAEGTFSIVTQPATGGSVSVTTQGTAALVMTTLNGVQGTGATLTLTDTTNFPSSGHYFIDNAGNAASDAAGPVTLDANDEIVSCTGKTSTTLTGCTRGIGNSSPVAHVGGENVYPIAYSTISVSPFDTTDTTVTLADNSAFAASGNIVVWPSTLANAEAFAYTGKSGSSLVGTANPTTNLPVGSDVYQFGRTADTGVISIDVDADFAGTFTYEFDYDLVAGDSTDHRDGD